MSWLLFLFQGLEAVFQALDASRLHVVAAAATDREAALRHTL